MGRSLTTAPPSRPPSTTAQPTSWAWATTRAPLLPPSTAWTPPRTGGGSIRAAEYPSHRPTPAADRGWKESQGPAALLILSSFVVSCVVGIDGGLERGAPLVKTPSTLFRCEVQVRHDLQTPIGQSKAQSCLNPIDLHHHMAPDQGMHTIKPVI
ncbi:hypothetical protein PAHAL_1G145900 [Panicum hallii]|uniref:Uncharacterized protein n=1 Tax=Panicum hallii TaxID=206008 RepID=A0A2T8KV94_9POAL|nr:hypothetical protein PAHAL_1G145900 [Panicum hallii]